MRCAVLCTTREVVQTKQRVTDARPHEYHYKCSDRTHHDSQVGLLDHLQVIVV